MSPQPSLPGHQLHPLRAPSASSAVTIPSRSALSEKVVKTSEITQLRDHFGHQRLREGKYTAGQIDTRWAVPIESDFTGWLAENIDKLPVAREQIQEILKERRR